MVLGQCDVCDELLGDDSAKVVQPCADCKANICAIHQFDIIGRGIAAMKRQVSEFTGVSLGRDVPCSYYHWVQNGDSWESISQAYGISIGDLQAMNRTAVLNVNDRICLNKGYSQGASLVQNSPLVLPLFGA